MSKSRYKITGPGIVRAVQKQADTQMDLVVIHEDDKSGRPVRVGYFLVEKGKPAPLKPVISWFDQSEINISLDETQNIQDDRAVLGADFIHPRANERHFIINLPFGDNNRFALRNLFRLKNNSVVEFVIQIEIRVSKDKKESWISIVRYDQAHDFIHRDMMASDGSKNKTKINIQDTKTAIIFAIDEIRDNLDLWLHQLGYLVSGQQILNQPSVVCEMDKAKFNLLKLYENPNSLKDTKSSYFNLHDGHEDLYIIDS